jgi:hypothetical protein
MSTGKSWADWQNIPTGVFGEICHGITIKEENRATVWEYRRAGIEILQKILRENYLYKGVPAVLFGVWESPEVVKYAVFCRDGWLKEVSEDE